MSLDVLSQVFPNADSPSFFCYQGITQSLKKMCFCPPSSPFSDLPLPNVLVQVSARPERRTRFVTWMDQPLWGREVWTHLALDMSYACLLLCLTWNFNLNGSLESVHYHYHTLYLISRWPNPLDAHVSFTSISSQLKLLWFLCVLEGKSGFV